MPPGLAAAAAALVLPLAASWRRDAALTIALAASAVAPIAADWWVRRARRRAPGRGGRPGGA
jgi:hypothetical protein